MYGINSVDKIQYFADNLPELVDICFLFDGDIGWGLLCMVIVGLFLFGVLEFYQCTTNLSSHRHANVFVFVVPLEGHLSIS